ncbi:hypothetical protein EW026_g6944 [Hermanssonia centrifuga]|uniref:Glycoside hydrolase family 31 protein n=1 Tax=Hermanssonia centrifuga TaxID=98765 RepID=A0A4V6S0U9_9APHY|nr:hypothetical protein EW026_g6944 [Hermanssonia centrifuga]
MWNDIDLYHALRDFTSDPVTFPAEEMRRFIEELASNNQHYIPIVDSAIGKQVNSTDFYDPYLRGAELGNITVNGTLTYGAGTSSDGSSLQKRGLGAAGLHGVDLTSPPYAIHNGNGGLGVGTLATNATHAGGYVELDTHNLWGMMEEKTTHLALQALHPGKRPFIISRSTFPSSGKWTGHWLGDNFSSWLYMHFSIQGVLQFQIFQIPFVGADTCGFQDNTDEELCGRWMQLSAFMPFFRNHNQRGALSQEPYRWDSVANASRTALNVRYSMLPYWYTLFANASQFGSPPVRALFYEFPDEPELFSIDQQYLIGRDILVTPVLTPNVSTVDGIFPGRGRVIWRDWYTHDTIHASTDGTNTTLSAPLGHINVHIRDGSVILLHAQPAYTIAETRQGPYSLLVSQAADGYAFGTAYIDDGETIPPTPNRNLEFHARKGAVTISGNGSFDVKEKLDSITILGTAAPSAVSVQGKEVHSWEHMQAQQKLVVTGLGLSLNDQITISWK